MDQLSNCRIRGLPCRRPLWRPEPRLQVSRQAAHLDQVLGEGVDLRAYLAMERQLASLTKKVGAVKDFRDNKFLEFGFNDIKVIKE